MVAVLPEEEEFNELRIRIFDCGFKSEITIRNPK